jgi:hypothetical protein
MGSPFVRAVDRRQVMMRGAMLSGQPIPTEDRMQWLFGLFLLWTVSIAPTLGAEASDPTLVINQDARPNAYGPDLHSDATGRPYRNETRDGATVHGPVQQDAYGPGVHMDQYGRPVSAVPAFPQ